MFLVRRRFVFGERKIFFFRLKGKSYGEDYCYRVGKEI